jgi:hypothetical protein
VRGYGIGVVDSPALVAADLACEYPPYMVDEATSQWLPRVEPLTPATQLPIGTQVEIRLKASKPLQSLIVFNPATQETQRFELSTAGETYKLPKLTIQDNLSLEVTMQDAEGVLSDRPQRLYIAAIRDETPRVAVKLAGISGLVTPDVLLPISG